ncbi:hypothetical protein AJ88_06880 [Mesorhizobium amorphae CCBAU 01583]|nr:hypothetical protein AJ88_06880 [Mesorhizobium amorphae CCBAU 01583]
MHVITTQSELETVVAAFEKSDFVTVDTEFIRETTFWPILCLIQMATPGVTALIDPLSPDIDLKPFFRLMANEAVVKVFHAARQDIEIIVHLGDLVPHPVFDTQVAAMVCGFGDSVPTTSWCSASPAPGSTSPLASPTGAIVPCPTSSSTTRWPTSPI